MISLKTFKAIAAVIFGLGAVLLALGFSGFMSSGMSQSGFHTALKYWVLFAVGMVVICTGSFLLAVAFKNPEFIGFLLKPDYGKNPDEFVNGIISSPDQVGSFITLSAKIETIMKEKVSAHMGQPAVGLSLVETYDAGVKKGLWTGNHRDDLVRFKNVRDGFSHKDGFNPPDSTKKVVLNCGILAYREVAEGSVDVAPIYDKKKAEMIVKTVGGLRFETPVSQVRSIRSTIRKFNSYFYSNEESETYPDDADAYSNLGKTYRNKGMFDQAIDAFKKAIEFDPSLAAAHFNLGNAYDDKGMYDQAVAAYKKAIELDLDFAGAYFNLGITHSNKGMYDLAVAAYKMAIELEPDFAVAHYNLGSTYNKKGMYDQAIAAYKKAIELLPDFADAHYDLGSTYHIKGMFDQAIDAYEMAIELDPDDAGAYKNLGNVYDEKGMEDEAKIAFEKARQLRR